MTNAIEWLRADLAADRERLAAMSPTDYLRAVVDTIWAPTLYVRTTIYAVIFSINHAATHADPHADVTFSWFDRPLTSELWRPADDIQASVGCLWFVAFLGQVMVSSHLLALPNDPVLAAYIVVLGVPLGLDPLLALAFTSGFGPECGS